LAIPTVGESTPDFDERAVVDAAKAGDERALTQLYEHYLPRVYRYVAARLGPGEDAEDVTSEVFLRVVDGIDRFSWRAVPFSAWLFRIAHNEVISHVRRRKTRGNTSQLDESMADPAEDHLAVLELQFTMATVRAATELLPDAQRQVIALRFGAGLSVAETARALKKSENNVKVLQHKAIAKLQKLVRRD
jgi:RNA polymerase sigma-70 factor (ECF subfamily)